MTKLLISVRNEEEAQLVSKYDIGILDVKEPDRGSLGASAPETLKAVANVVPKEIRKSFSAGELTDWLDEDLGNSNPLNDRYGEELLQRFDFVKVGLAMMRNCQPGAKLNQIINSGPTESGFLWQDMFQSLFRAIPPSTKPVFVAYLDWQKCGAPFPDEVIELASRIDDCEFVLLDTFHKPNNLLSSVSITELSRLVELCSSQRVKTVVAGSINLDCIGKVTSTRPDFIGVRGAVCGSDRRGEIDAKILGNFLDQFQTNAKKFLD